LTFEQGLYPVEPPELIEIGCPIAFDAFHQDADLVAMGDDFHIRSTRAEPLPRPAKDVLAIVILG
jgi:hypothetical protein